MSRWVRTPGGRPSLLPVCREASVLQTSLQMGGVVLLQSHLGGMVSADFLALSLPLAVGRGGRKGS